MSRVNRRLVPELTEEMSIEGDILSTAPPVNVSANVSNSQSHAPSSPDTSFNTSLSSKQRKKLFVDICPNSSQESLNSDVCRDTSSANTHSLSSATVAPPSDISEACPPILPGELPRSDEQSKPVRTSSSSQDLPPLARTLSRNSRDSTPDDPTVDPVTPRSNGHRRSSSRSSDPEYQSTPVNGATAMKMDFQQMRVSLILKDEEDDYAPDDLSIVGKNPSGGEILNYSERSSTPTSLQNITESGPDAVSYDWTRDGDNSTPSGCAGVPIREGRRTPTNGQLSDSSGRQSFESASPPSMTRVSSIGKISSSDKKKKQYWYNVLNPTYKSRSEDFKRIFKDIPADERLIVDYSCALQKDILVHGRLYITQSFICFYANIFRWETVLTLRCRDITCMTKEKTARVIPNAIQISNKDDKYFFTSFGTRDKTYLMMFRVWQNALAENPMTPQELWQWVHYSYGEELGLNSSDEDYIHPSTEDEHMFQSRIQQEESMVAAMEGAGVGDKDDTDSIVEPVTNGDLSTPSPPVLISDPPQITDNDGTDNIIHRPPPIKVHPVDGTSPDLLTDLGDTTEEDEEEVVCSGHGHLEIDVIEGVYNFSVDKLFEMIFTDSQLYRHFAEVKKTTELVQSPWSEEVDAQGDQNREISYTLSLNYSIGPKTSPATEKQMLRSDSKPGAFYLVDTECINSSIPYGDNFYVINRYCLNRVAPNRCRLKITSGVRYRKSVWGLVKNFIEKNVTNGIIDSFTCIADLLQQESVQLGQQASIAAPAGKKKVLRRRRNVSDRTQSNKRVCDTQNTQGTPVKAHPQKTPELVADMSTPTIDDGQVPITRPLPPDNGLSQSSSFIQSQSPCDSPVWLEIMGDICKKAAKRLHQLRVLRRSGCHVDDMVTYYVSMMQSVLDYAAPLWHGNLTQEEEECIENIQQRALNIIYPGYSYSAALVVSNLERLSDRRRSLYETYFRQFWGSSDPRKLNLRHALTNIRNTNDSQQGETLHDYHTLHDIISADQHKADNGAKLNINSKVTSMPGRSQQLGGDQTNSTISHGVHSKVRDVQPHTITADVLVRVICAVLIILAVFNGLLYYKLSSLEQKATLLSHGRIDLWKNIQDQPKTQQDWLDLIQQQQTLHDTEIERWKDILSTSIKLMQNMQQTLQTLEQGIQAKYATNQGTEDAGTNNPPPHDEH